MNINDVWRETKDGLIIDGDGNVIMSAAMFHASCRTISVPINHRADNYQLGESTLRQIRISHKTY